MVAMTLTGEFRIWVLVSVSSWTDAVLLERSSGVGVTETMGAVVGTKRSSLRTIGTPPSTFERRPLASRVSSASRASKGVVMYGCLPSKKRWYQQFRL
jgi:hypothetical protein